MRKVKGCLLRGETYHARMVIPKDIRHCFGNRHEFSQSLGTGDPFVAETLSAAKRIEWKGFIKAARLGAHILHQPKSRAELLEEIKDAFEEFAWTHFSGNDDEEGIPREVLEDAWLDFIGSGEAPEAIETISEIEEQAMLEEGSLLKSKIDSYLVTMERLNRGQKYIDDMARILQLFTDRFPTIESITTSTFRDYLFSLKGRKQETRASVAQMIKVKNRITQFLIFCGERGAATTIADIKLDQKRAKKQNAAEHFSDAQIDLILSSINSNDTLSVICKLALYTGARIEELCDLKVQPNDGLLRIDGTKTEMARRIIPVHPKIQELINTLITDSTDGWLLQGLAPDKYGQRSGAIGKRFGRLKKKLGFSDRHRFHSFRATFLQKLRNLRCPEATSALIAGHEHPAITYGHYADRVTPEVLSEMKEWISKINYSETK